jgi:DNA-binding winged helix-turn-helix (wHTH) protein
MRNQLANSTNIFQTHRWAILTGIDTYQDAQIPALQCRGADAQLLNECFLSHPSFGYQAEQITLFSGEATRLKILASLARQASQASEDDLLLFYFSGYGELVNDEAYLLPSDATCDRSMADSAIPLRRIKEILQTQARARARVILLDVHLMGLPSSTRSPLQTQQTFTKSALQDSAGVAVFVCATQAEYSLTSPKGTHSVFTHTLFESLEGSADRNADSKITLDEVASYSSFQVKDWASRHLANQSLRPTLDFEGSGDIILLTTDSAVTASRGKTPPVVVDPIEFSFLKAVKETKDFYDRQAALDEIRQILYTTTDILVAVHGERCIGKTSLINRTRNLLKEEDWGGRRFLQFALEPSSTSTVEDFAREIFYGLQRTIREAGLVTPPDLENPFEFVTFTNFGHLLERIGAQFPDITFVVFVDEFDKFIHQVSEMDYKRIGGLVHYIVERTDFPMVFFISLLQELPGAYGSPVPQHRITLQPFGPSETDEMIVGILKGGCTPAAGVLPRIYELTGGHPYFVKMLLKKYLRQAAQKKLTSPAGRSFTLEAVEDARRQVVNDPDTQDLFTDIYKTYFKGEEQKALLWIVSHAGATLSGAEIASAGGNLQAVLSHLIERGYLQRREDGSIALRLGLMGDWLKKWGNLELEMEVHNLRQPVEAMQPNQSNQEITPHGLCIDLSTRLIYVDGDQSKITLTDLQFRGLVYLARNSGLVVSRENLAKFLHPDETYTRSDESLDTLIHHIRKAIDDLDKPHRYLETHPRSGFSLKDVVMIKTVQGQS